MELRDRDEALAWVAAGLSLSRLASFEDAKAIALPWLIDSVSETGRIPPPGVILDFGRLFSGHPLRSSVPLPVVAAPLRAALRSFEDHVLGRVEVSPHLDPLIDAFSPLAPVERARAIGVLTANIVGRLGISAVSVSPGVLRRLVDAPGDELAAAAAAGLSAGSLAGEELLRGYLELTERAHRAAALLTEADVFIVENIGVLADLTERLAIGEILEASAERRAALPKRIKARRRPANKHVLTALSDEDHYPTGGFSSIATSGTMENLVISELIYMEDPGEGGAADPGVGAVVDLFDLRYAEGELLYYTRDESQFVRDHRAIGVALMGDLVRARIKDRGARRQRLIELFGVLHCVVARLAEWLSEHALHIVIRTVDEQGRDRLAAERGLLEVLFTGEIERGLVAIERCPSHEVAVAAPIGDPRAVPEWVTVTTRKLPPPGADHASLRIADITPRLSVGGGPERELESWDEAALALLHRLV